MIILADDVYPGFGSIFCVLVSVVGFVGIFGAIFGKQKPSRCELCGNDLKRVTYTAEIDGTM